MSAQNTTGKPGPAALPHPLARGWPRLRLRIARRPTTLFVIPGATMLVAGLFVVVMVVTNARLFGREWQLHAMIGAVLLAIVGGQTLQLGAFAACHLGARHRLLDAVRDRVELEHGLLLGGLLLLVGTGMVATVVIMWISRGLGTLREEKLALSGALLIMLGAQTVFSAFFLSVLGLPHRDPRDDRC